MLNKKEYENLFKAIKNSKIDKNYKPKKYNFGLKNFDEKGRDKKREPGGSQDRFMQ